jgi:hypothetical protein
VKKKLEIFGKAMHGFSVQNVFFPEQIVRFFSPKKSTFVTSKIGEKQCSQLPDFLSTRAADPAPMCNYRRETLEGVTWGVTGGVGRLSKIGTDPNCCQEGS